jgi:hypothetical protein
MFQLFTSYIQAEELRGLSQTGVTYKMTYLVC